jgi:hypothetical protein
MTMSDRAYEVAPGAMPESAQIRDFLVQLDSTFHSRVNLLLVAESLFLAAVSQVWSSKESWRSP